MRLEKKILDTHREEIADLYRLELGEDPVNGLIYFGIFGEDGELQAVAAVKNYMGSWYLRGHVVKPEYRGQGMQRLLIRESLDYLRDKTDIARVSVYPWNEYSKRNIEAEGFEFEKRKKLANGETVLVYKLRFGQEISDLKVDSIDQ